MSSISLNKSVDQPVGPAQVVEPVTSNPASEEQVGPSQETGSNVVTSSFHKENQKFYPIVRKLFTDSWNGDLGQLSTVKKVLAAVTGFFLSLVTSVVTVPLVALKNLQIKAFNAMAPYDQMKRTILDDIEQVVDSAKAYRSSPDSHTRKLDLQKKIHQLGETIDKINMEFPDEATRLTKLIREKVEGELDSLMISIKPQSSHDQHRFTIPLASLVLDGFYPMIGDVPNPIVKGVQAQSITYQFEDGIFNLSQERIIKNFFVQMEKNPLKAAEDLQKNLDKIKRPTKAAAKEVRDAITGAIAEKLNNPTNPEFQKFAIAARQLLDNTPGLDEDNVMSPEQLENLSSSLVSANVLSKAQQEVFLAQVKGDEKAPSLFALEAATKQHEKKARRALKAAIAAAALAASSFGVSQYLSVSPALQVAQKWFAEHAPALLQTTLVNFGPKVPGIAAATAAAAVEYGIYHALRAKKGPKMTHEQEAARSFANAIRSRNETLEKAKDIEYQAFAAELPEDISKDGLDSLKDSIMQADRLIQRAGDALESAGKNPTPKMIERIIQLTESANEQYQKVKKEAEALAARVDLDLSGHFKEANSALKRVDNRLNGAQGVSDKGNKKLEELQKSLEDKVAALAKFESIDLEQARTDLVRVEVLEAEIQRILEAKKANPAKEKKWELSLAILHKDLVCRKERTKRVHATHEAMKAEIAQIRELIQLLGSS